MAKIVPATARTPHRSKSTIVSEKEQQKNVSSWAEFEKELHAIRNSCLRAGRMRSRTCYFADRRILIGLWRPHWREAAIGIWRSPTTTD